MRIKQIDPHQILSLELATGAVLPGGADPEINMRLLTLLIRFSRS
jgi:hypothetical protein